MLSSTIKVFWTVATNHIITVLKLETISVVLVIECDYHKIAVVIMPCLLEPYYVKWYLTQDRGMLFVCTYKMKSRDSKFVWFCWGGAWTFWCVADITNCVQSTLTKYVTNLAQPRGVCWIYVHVCGVDVWVRVGQVCKETCWSSVHRRRDGGIPMRSVIRVHYLLVKQQNRIL